MEGVSGHHFSVAEVLIKQHDDDSSPYTIDIVGNRKKEWVSALNKTNNSHNLLPHFDTYFYQYYEKYRPLAEFNGYIAKLGGEYYRAIHSYCKLNQLVIVLYPTINWEHANALTYALTKVSGVFPQVPVIHCVCLMASPGDSQHSDQRTIRHWLNSKFSINNLLRQKSVMLFASDAETAQRYQELLSLPKPLPIHPCLLGDWKEQCNTASKPVAGRNKALKITLYCGDAKPSKGFLELPAILKQLLLDLRKNVEIWIQYTVTGHDSRITAASNKLDEIASVDSRVRIHKGYWQDATLHENLRGTDYFVFSYDLNTYAHKTSGLLWLAAWHHLTIVCFGHSWLTREAARLDVTTLITSPDKIAATIDNHQLKPITMYPVDNSNAQSQVYRKQLYRPFTDWFADITTKSAKELSSINA